MNFCTLATLLQVTLVFGQDITLFKNRQEDCVTKCIKGLISGSDTVRFTAQINHSDEKIMRLQFFVKQEKESKFKLLSSYNLPDDCQNKENFECINVSPEVTNITIGEKAFTDLSGASIYGTLMTPRLSERRSKTQRFPLICDPSKTNGSLFINGKEITTVDENCLNDAPDDLHIVYKCKSQVSPCLIDIQFDDGEKHLNGTDSVELNKNIKGSISGSFTIYYGACTLEESVNIKRCIIRGQPQEFLLEMTIALAAASSSLILILLLILLKLIMRCKQSKNMPIESEMKQRTDKSEQKLIA